MKINYIRFGIILATLLVFSPVSDVFAQVSGWTEPRCAPPNCNVPAPINVGTDTQAKEGRIIINGTSFIGNLNSPAWTAGIEKRIDQNERAGLVFGSGDNGAMSWFFGNVTSIGSASRTLGLGVVGGSFVQTWLPNGSIGIGTGDTSLGLGGSRLNSKFTVVSAATAIAAGYLSGSDVQPAFALNPLSNGSFTFYDYGDGNFKSGITQKGGSVGIGTSAPSAKLEIVGGATKTTGGLIIETRTGSDVASPETGRMWLRTDVSGGTTTGGGAELPSCVSAGQTLIWNGSAWGCGASAGGGVTEIVAGNNISTSPTPGVGRVTINATGISGSGLPSGSAGQTLRHSGTGWIANDVIYNNGTNVGIGTNSPRSKLEVAGGSIRVTGYNNAVSGAGFEVGYTGDVTYMNSIDRGTDLRKPIWMNGLMKINESNSSVTIGDMNNSNAISGPRLEVFGKIKIGGGAPGLNKILASSDASGLASWKTKEELGLGGGGGIVFSNEVTCNTKLATTNNCNLEASYPTYGGCFLTKQESHLASDAFDGGSCKVFKDGNNAWKLEATSYNTSDWVECSARCIGGGR